MNRYRWCFLLLSCAVVLLGTAVVRLWIQYGRVLETLELVTQNLYYISEQVEEVRQIVQSIS